MGNGDGTFQPGVSYNATAAANTIALGDFNGDGYTDIAAAVSTAGIAVLSGLGDGTFQQPKFVLTVASNSMAVGDFNNDGNLDILTETPTGFSLLPGNGDGTFQKPVASAASMVAYPPSWRRTLTATASWMWRASAIPASRSSWETGMARSKPA